MIGKKWGCSLAILLAAVLFLAGCATNPATGRPELALMSISTQEEIDIGQKMFPRVVQQMGGTYPDDALQNYVQAVGDRLQQASHRQDLDFTFKVVNDSTPNAFAMPGGFIAISRGLLVNLENEAQLAAVLGHEIGHVDARHAVQGLQRGSLLGLGLAVLSGASGSSQYAGLIRSSGEVAATLIDRSYSRSQESESDRLGIDYMVDTGYNPYGAVGLQEIFYRKIDKGSDPAWLEGLFRTHPFSSQRLENNRAYINQKYPRFSPVEDQGRTAFDRAVADLKSAQPGYELYDRARLAEKNGRPDEAIALYLQAAAAAPDESLILTGLGMAYLRQEDLVSAKRHLTRAVRFDDDYFYSQLGLGYVYLEQKDYPQAITHLQTSLDLLPTLQGGYFLARAYDGADRKKDALELYKAVAEADPDGKLGDLARERLRQLGAG